MKNSVMKKMGNLTCCFQAHLSERWIIFHSKDTRKIPKNIGNSIYFPECNASAIIYVLIKYCSVNCALFVNKFMEVVVSDDDSFVASEYSKVVMDKKRAKTAHDLLTEKKD
jgi:hypothetical protein